MIAPNGPEATTNAYRVSFRCGARQSADCANRANLFHCYQAGELGRTHWDAACSDSVTWQNQTITLVNRILGQPAGW